MSKENDIIISGGNSISKIENQVKIGEKILAISEIQKDRELLIQLCEDLNISLTKICFRRFSFTQSFINRNEDLMDWDTLSYNRSVIWSEELIERYEDKWDWEALGTAITQPLSKEFFKKYKKKWNWEDLIYHGGMIITKDFVEEFRTEILSSGVSEEDLDEFFTNSEISHLPEISPIEKLNTPEPNFYELSSQTNFPWTEEIISKHRNRWDWELISLNPSVPWTTELIKEFENDINWKYFSWNTGLPWSKEFVNAFITKWNWEYLSANPSWPVTLEFYEAFKEYFVEECLFWNKETDFEKRFTLLEREDLIYASDSNLDLLVGRYYVQPEFLEKYGHFFDWRRISGNKKNPWSDTLLEKFEDKINWHTILNNEIWDAKLLSKYIDLILKVDEELPLRKLNQHLSKIFLEITDEDFVEKIITS